MKKSAKKWLAVFTVLAVLAVAGGAMAYGGRQGGYGRGGYGPGGCYGPGGGGYGPGYMRGGGYGPGGVGCPGWGQGFGQGLGQGFGPNGGGMYGGWGYAEIPQEIRDKQAEADKLTIDLRTELNKPQADKAKALEIWRKHHALRGEIAEWFFTQQLERMANWSAPRQ